MTDETSVSPWRRMYEREGTAFTVDSAEVMGEIPAQLRGVHYRVGPVGGAAFGQRFGNLFSDADGYVCAYRFGDKVSVRGDRVRTGLSDREHAAGRHLVNMFGTLSHSSAAARLLRGLKGVRSFLPGVDRGAQLPVKDSPNHVPCVLGGSLVLTGGAGRPHTLHADDLSPLGVETFGGALPSRQVYLVGESHGDPLGDDCCFLELTTFPNGVRLWSVGPDGRGRASRRVGLPRRFVPHDFGLTRTKIIVPAGPLYANLPGLVRAALGLGTMSSAFRWHPGEPTRYFVIDRRTHEVRVFHTDASYPTHIANAFDDGDDVVMYVSVHSDDAAVRGYTSAIGYDSGHADFTNSVHRVRLASTGEMTSERLVPFACEALCGNDAYDGMPSRYVYATVVARGVVGSDGVVKVDVQSGEHQVFRYGEGCVTAQPVFAARPGGVAEDDGWLLCQVYDSAADLSFLSILQSDLSKEVARVVLPCALPYLLHGTFTAG